MDLAEFRSGVDAWLDANVDELAPAHDANGSLDEHVAQVNKIKRMTYDAGWARWGWPERVGGLGGDNLCRAYLAEVLVTRDLVQPGPYCMTEVLAPTMIGFAAESLAAEMVPQLLRGEETWCQGFSEPSTGSNLAALACTATRTDTGWRVSGQKVWTSYAQYAQRCVLLTRSGDSASRHKGITALFVDMDSPGISVRPIHTMHGVDEFCEVFFDDVEVPIERMLGNVGDGWAVAMDLLPYERSTSLWLRGAYLSQRLHRLVETADEGSIDARDLGAAMESLYAFRARSRDTQHRLARGEKLGAETSIDKILLAQAEQTVYDLVAATLPEHVVTGDDAVSSDWRAEFLYSRAATIYGGTSEIQRNIVARRLLDLADEA
ncbi:MAG TPA: acyl-CoA dehydrogenase family protein [Mycobacteriales bacterium]|jgi:alkylation response protein AidB-like acyl-CoA dehydrogenase|nr:acyl-CoA dehydrogenase family protein [Mycobacteriales bacterium]